MLFPCGSDTKSDADRSGSCVIIDTSGLQDPRLYETARGMVLPWRRELADSFVFGKDRRLSLTAGLVITAVEGRYGRVSVGDGGKPFCEGIGFNISHSGTYVAYAE